MDEREKTCKYSLVEVAFLTHSIEGGERLREGRSVSILIVNHCALFCFCSAGVLI